MLKTLPKRNNFTGIILKIVILLFDKAEFVI